MLLLAISLLLDFTITIWMQRELRVCGSDLIPAKTLGEYDAKLTVVHQEKIRDNRISGQDPAGEIPRFKTPVR